MPDSIYFLTATAATLGFFHSLLGPDHYLPFLAMSKAEGWSRAKTLAVTALCGLGHVFSSVLIGTIGIAFGALFRLEILESVRVELSAWPDPPPTANGSGRYQIFGTLVLNVNR